MPQVPRTPNPDGSELANLRRNRVRPTDQQDTTPHTSDISALLIDSSSNSHTPMAAALAELSHGLSEQEVAVLIDTCRQFLWTGASSDLGYIINHEPAQVWGPQWQRQYPGLARWVGRLSSRHAQALLDAAERFWQAEGLSPSQSIGDALRAIGLLQG